MSITRSIVALRLNGVLRRIGLPILLATVTVFLDVLTKVLAESSLDLHEPVTIFGDVARLTLGYNTGVAFGMFRDGGVLLLIMTAVMIVGLATLLMAGPRAGITPLAARALGLMLGGAIANFMDRWVDGRVTDFLDFGLGALRWPTFNLADSIIVLGVLMILLVTIVPQALDDPSEARA